MNKYQKQNKGNDSVSKKLIQSFFKSKGYDMAITRDRYDYIDGYIELNGRKVGIEIKDRSDKYDSTDFNDVICERGKLDKFLFERSHPNTANHKGI